MFFSPFSIAITSLGEKKASIGAFRTFVRFALVWFCLFPLLLGVLEGLGFVIVALPGLFPYPFFTNICSARIGVLYLICETLKTICHISNHCDENKQRAKRQSTERTQKHTHT